MYASRLIGLTVLVVAAGLGMAGDGDKLPPSIAHWDYLKCTPEQISKLRAIEGAYAPRIADAEKLAAPLKDAARKLAQRQVDGLLAERRTDLIKVLDDKQKAAMLKKLAEPPPQPLSDWVALKLTYLQLDKLQAIAWSYAPRIAELEKKAEAAKDAEQQQTRRRLQDALNERRADFVKVLDDDQKAQVIKGLPVRDKNTAPVKDKK